MDKEMALPKRKHPRLNNYDYSSAEAYFITICTQDKRCVLSHITAQAKTAKQDSITAGASPRPTVSLISSSHCAGQELTHPTVIKPTEMEYTSSIVGRGLAPAEIITTEYTTFGEIAEKQLLLLEARYSNLAVDQYVIMPDHIHAILVLNQAAGASPRPTITDIICTYKSLTARECRQNGFKDKLFQTSFYEHIIRDQEDYENIVSYIYENPLRRYLRSL